MGDRVIKFGQSVIQHGKENDRVYLMKLSLHDLPHIMPYIDRLVAEYGYTKVFAKIPFSAKGLFADGGYVQEARIPGFYNCAEDCCFMGKFYTEERKREKDIDKVREVLDCALDKKALRPILPPAYAIRKAVGEDVGEMVDIYREVFETYPFPIHEKEYVLKTMDNDVVYFGVWHQKRLVALSSCEIDCNQSNAEMTDFATLPEYRGQNMALRLLVEMEEELERRKIYMAYTIARANSFGMNITFAKADYTFAGTLINNTNISGGVESMNVWYKAMR